jgi:para-aminobenzoate synthetase
MQQSLGVTGDSSPVNEQRSSGVSDTPTAAFFLARNSLVFHHPSRMWYMISLIEQDKDLIQVVTWMKTTKRRILDLTKLPESPPSRHIHNPNASFKNIIQFIPSLSKEQYEAAIAKCHELIRQGESYELCLTNQLEVRLPHALSTWELYKLLRQRNPAPYSAFFRWQHRDCSRKHLSICCSSPERFMCVQRKQLVPGGPFVLQAEAKPIKGTARRVLPSNGVSRNEAEEAEDQQLARELEFSLKNRAENLMIVDLLRNDMSRVCQIGSVHVAKLMAIESFATVHQMVSTIRGVLGTDGSQEKPSNCIDLLRASFPGGSMTGAPKTRTMELLEELEQHDERGPYAGSLGYISVNGCMDMNIIIRSAVVIQDGENRQRIKIGAGGAITALSEPKDEYDEMLLKSGAVVQAVQDWVAAFEPPPVLDANATLAVSASSA